MILPSTGIMRTVILYISRHGSAEKSANLLKEKVNGEVTLVNLKYDKIPDLEIFETVIIGGSIHMGHIQNQVKKFCSRYERVLLEKRLGLYLCCMKTGEEAQQQFIDAFPDILRQHAEVKGIFGGEFLFEKMNFLERMIIKKSTGIKESVSSIDPKIIDHFVTDLSISSQKEIITPGH